MAARDRRDELYEEYLAVPSHLRAEIVNGTLYVSPRPAPRHANASSVLGSELNAPFQRGRGGPGGWWILDEPELHLGLQVVVPDLAGWRRERMPEMPEVAYFELAPDWVCEVLSPSTATIDRIRKMRHYLRAGVSHVWLLDPVPRTLEVYSADADRWIVASNFGDLQKVRATPFDAIELDLALWWFGDDE